VQACAKAVEKDVDQVVHITHTDWQQLAGSCVHRQRSANIVIPQGDLVYPRYAQA